VKHIPIYSKSVELIETPTFTRQITALLMDEEYRGFQSKLAANPESGPRLKGGGIRKIRVALPGRGKSRRRSRDLLLGGPERFDPVAFAYRKNATADLSPKQVAQLAKAVKEEFGDEAEHV
jgi:hypothetical protein